MVGADAVQLYPSLDHQALADAVFEVVMLIPVTWEHCDWEDKRNTVQSAWKKMTK